MTTFSLYIGSSEVVSLAAEVFFTSIRVSWGPPRTPNGIIRSYEVVYRTGIGLPIVINTHLNLFLIISKLTPSTSVDITVFAVNNAGRGEEATLQNIVTLDVPRKIYIITSFTVFIGHHASSNM